MTAPRSLADLTLDEIHALLESWGEPRFRARQIFTWVHARGEQDYEAMTDLPKTLRERLAGHLPVRASTVARTEPSEDGAVKLLVRLADGECVECVLIPEGDRLTACLSSQVGCGVGCIFCASGTDGAVRNLSAGEIVEQGLHLTAYAGRRLTNIVMMGMGEPLHNVFEVAKALRILQAPEGQDLGARRITVSTSGPEKGFDEFLALGLQVKLAISLHAAKDGVRRRLVPRGGTGNVAALRNMADRWFLATGRDTTFEYVLIDGLNDGDEDMEALARVAGRHVNVNMIPLNPVAFAPELRAPPAERIDRCVSFLESRGLVVHIRRQRGDDVAAACGQLRLQDRHPS